jgi:hypothetical protein
MTTTSISNRSRPTDAARWRSIRADLAFWTVVGGVVAALDRQLGAWWNVPRTTLLVGGLSFLLVGPILLLVLNRIRPVSAGLVTGFVVTNLLLAPIAAVAAWFGWLGLSAAGKKK